MMTSCLFLAAGLFAKYLGAVKLEDLSGLFRKMPLASAGFIVGGLALVGVPPTCGFFSKFYLIRGAIDAGQWIYVAALLGSSLVNAVLFFRLFEIAHFGKHPVESHDGHGHVVEPVERREPPLHALAPLLGAAAILILLGLFNGPVVEFIRTALTANPLVETTAAVSTAR
jgi:multicomponent Na+:H+ antiporter subunit D